MSDKKEKESFSSFFTHLSSRSSCSLCFGHLVIGAWSLFVIWSLGFGILELHVIHNDKLLHELPLTR
jgi:hypothetical protein